MTAYDTAVLADNPLFYWTLATDASDSSGNGRNGTVTGAWNYGVASGIGSLGNGSTSGSSSSYIRSPNIAFSAGKVAVEAWADTPSISALLWGFGVQYIAANLNGGIRLNNGSSDASITTAPVANRHHLVIQFTPGSTAIEIYVDNLSRVVSNPFSPVTLGTTFVQISGYGAAASFYLPSGHYVSHFAVYQGGLSAARVQAHYLAAVQTSNGTFTDIASLEGWFEPRASDAGTTPATIPDRSGRNRPMTLGSGVPLIRAAATPAGAPTIQFTTAAATTTNQYYLMATGLLTERVAGEAFILMRALGDPPTVGDGRLWKFGSDGNSEHIPYADGNIYDGFGSTSRKNATVNPAQSTSASWVVYNVRAAANAWSQWLDEVQIYSTTSNTVGWTPTPRLGENWVGDVAALVVCSSVLTSAERALVMTRLNALRYALSLSDAFAASGSANTVGVELLPQAAPFDSTNFTTEASEPLTLPVAKTGWAHFRVYTSGTYQIDTIGTGFDTGIALYTGATIDALTLVASDNDSGGSGTSLITASLVPGTTYHLQVGSGTGTTAGTGVVNLKATGLLTSEPAVTILSTSQQPGHLMKGRATKALDLAAQA